MTIRQPPGADQPPRRESSRRSGNYPPLRLERFPGATLITRYNHASARLWTRGTTWVAESTRTWSEPFEWTNALRIS